jgi:hypothetical protein
MIGLACTGFAARAFACAGEVERAREVVGYILSALEDTEPPEPGTSDMVSLAAATVWQLHTHDLAEQLLPRALALADADGHESYMTSSELSVARLSTVLDRLRQAIDYFERARVTLERRNQPMLQAIVDYDEALARIAHEQPGSGRLWAIATTQLEHLGMREWSRHARSVSGVSISSVVSSPAGLTSFQSAAECLDAIAEPDRPDPSPESAPPTRRREPRVVASVLDLSRDGGTRSALMGPAHSSRASVARQGLLEPRSVLAYGELTVDSQAEG